MSPSQAVYMRALLRATQLVGGNLDLLAVFLDVSPKQVTLWMSGVVQMPDDAFLKVVDLLMDQRDSATREAQRATSYASRS